MKYIFVVLSIHLSFSKTLSLVIFKYSLYKHVRIKDNHCNNCRNEFLLAVFWMSIIAALGFFPSTCHSGWSLMNRTLLVKALLKQVKCD